MNQLKTKLRPARVVVAGIFLGGITISTSVQAMLSVPTSTVIGHAPVLRGRTAGEITVTDTNKNGLIDVGDELKIDSVNLRAEDVDGDVLTTYDYTWKVGGVAVPGTTGSSYVIKTGDEGKAITLSVIGHTDPAATDPAISPSYDATFVANIPLSITAKVKQITVVASTDIHSVDITGLNASGAPVVGQPLSVNVKDASGVQITAGLKYQWRIQDSRGKFVDIAGPKGTAATYTPVAGDQKKQILVDVTK